MPFIFRKIEETWLNYIDGKSDAALTEPVPIHLHVPPPQHPHTHHVVHTINDSALSSSPSHVHIVPRILAEDEHHLPRLHAANVHLVAEEEVQEEANVAAQDGNTANRSSLVQRSA